MPPVDAAAANPPADPRLQIFEKFMASPVLAHDVVFAARHTNTTPEFHKQIISDFWSRDEYVGEEAFRGGGKSSIAEEAITLMALMGLEPYFLIIGSSHDRAVDRLTAIKYEIENNGIVEKLWGDQRGSVWNEDEIILKNGTKIQAIGARAKFRGVKYRNTRPTFLLIDDLEDEDNTNSDKKRERLARWVSRVVFPACQHARKRIAGTPIHPQCWLETMRKSAGWTFRVHPIVIPAVSDPEKWETSQWPDRFSLADIRGIRDNAERSGDLGGFVQEYLCQSEEAALKPFQASHIIVDPNVPPWAPSVVICDPARSVGAKSARTGYSVISWVGTTLYERYAHGGYDMPSTIVEELFRLNEAFNPIWIAVEKDGLEQFLLQPIRQESIKRGVVLPLKPLMAPRDRSKENFIRGLQPFFAAGEIRMAAEFPELRKEILNFPTGLNDILNTLAYALRLRAGKPVYEDFGLGHVAPESLRPREHQPLWLVVNVEPNYTTAALVQHMNRSIRVFADWVKEGGVDEALESVLPEALQVAKRSFTCFAPGEQFDQFNNFGLPRVQKRLGIEFAKGPKAETSAGSLAAYLRSRGAYEPAFLINKSARWTINALSSGYARELDKAGILSKEPSVGYYATLMRGVESFARWVDSGAAGLPGHAANYDYTPDGRRFISARAGAGNEARAVVLKRD